MYIKKGQQLTFDYGYDVDFVDIESDVDCLCESKKCRKLLLISKEKDRTDAKKEDYYDLHWKLISKKMNRNNNNKIKE